MKPRLKRIADQVIVLTGATSGIGLVTARKAAARGARLVLAARNEEVLKLLARELTGKGADVTWVTADVGIEDDVRRIADTALQRFGRFDTWVNNAGVGMFGTNEETTLEDKQRLFDTNYWGVVHGSLFAVRHLKRHGGALINIGSGFSDRATPLQGIYAASKHAVEGYTDSLRMELEEEGAPVSVTLIKPASVDSMFISHAKNMMDVEPRLPPPVYAPDIVADAILYAAAHPKRDIEVGAAAKLLAVAEYAAPGMLDIVMQRVMPALQRTTRPPHPRGRDNLHTASQDGIERDELAEPVLPVLENSLYTNAVLHPKATGAVLLGAGIALAAIWQANRPAARRDA